MTDRDPLPEKQNDTPEDVASLYSWANLHGGKYRDFSAARAQTREQVRQNVQQAMEDERSRALPQGETRPAAENPRPAEPTPVALPGQPLTQNPIPQERVDEVAAAAQAVKSALAAHAAQSAAAARAAQQVQQAQQAQQAAQAAQAAAPKVQQQQHPSTEWQGSAFDRRPSPPVGSPTPYSPPQQANSASPASQPNRPSPEQNQAPFPPARDEFISAAQNPRAQPEPRQFGPAETAHRPAWLASERAEAASQPAGQHAPADTLQGSRDRMATRWFALKGVFEAVHAPVEAPPAPAISRPPVVAVFSLAGGVGKTSLVATLGRALSARGEKVLLVDTATFGLLPFFFGAQDQRPGQLRTFSPPSGSGDAPIQMVTIDRDAMGTENLATELLSTEIAKYGLGASRIIIDLATASGAIARHILKMNPLVIIPVVPDMNSVVSVGSIDSFFQRNTGAAGSSHLPYYVLNQFDPSLPLHLDVREVLRERLGDRLLAFALRRAPSVSEALAEGMTVLDYAPNSTVSEDFASLAGWVKSLSAPAASSSFRGVRWSER